MKRPIMTICMQNQHCIKIELFPDITPNTVHSIIHLAQQGRYNGRPFFRVVKDFVLQTSCELTTTNPNGCDYMLDSECKHWGHPAEQPLFTKGMVGMAGMGGAANCSDASSFFILTGDCPRLDGSFPVVGQVVEGMDEVERINNVPVIEIFHGTTAMHKPAQPEIIASLTVETFGISYPAPKTKPFTEEYLAGERELEHLRGES